MNIFTTRLTTSLVVIGTLLLSGCDSKEDAGVKTIARFKDLTRRPSATWWRINPISSRNG